MGNTILDELTPDVSGGHLLGYTEKSGRFHERKLDYLCDRMLGLCGCGNPYGVAEHIYDILVAIGEKNDKQRADMTLADEFIRHWLSENGYTEHWTSVYYGWLTPLGQELRDALEDALTECER